MLHAHLIHRKLLVFRHPWLPFFHVVCRLVDTKAAFSAQFLFPPPRLLTPKLSLLLYIAVNYYVCNFKYTIWGLDPWNSNLLLFSSLPRFFASAKRKLLLLGAQRKVRAFSSRRAQTRGICLDYWIAGKSNMWWRHKGEMKGKKVL